MSIFGKERDQQEERTYQRYLDQHGREWGAVIELAKTSNEPVGPIDPQFKAPWLPDQKYLKTNSKKHHGRLHIDYERMAADRRQALDAFDKTMFEAATLMYGDQAAAHVENPTPALLLAVGQPPQPVGPVLLAQRGDPWILGLTTELPAWATAPNRPAWVDALVAPKPKAQRKAEADGELPPELEFLKEMTPRTSDSRGQSSVTQGEADGGYPAYVRAAGRGIGVWKLSSGAEFKGSKADAVEAEAEIQGLAESVSAGTPVHASWSES